MQHHILGRTKRNDFTARISTLWSQINQPVRRTNHVQIVFNDDQRMTYVQQLAQSAHQLGNVVKVQAGGRLIQHEQRTALSQKL